MIKSILIVTLVTFLSFGSDAQMIVKPGYGGGWVNREANIAYNPTTGWKELDTAFNNKPLTHKLLFKCIARWGFYKSEKDMFMILGTRGIRSFAGHLSDSAANNYYLSPEYLSQDGLVSLKEEVASPAMLKETHADDIVSYRIKLDTPFLGKYHFAKRFLLHRQDVADVTLNFVALNKSKEREINKAFKKLWGMIRFRPDSAFQPEFKTDLVGKFRHLRPQLNTKDSLTNVRNRKWMHFNIAMFNGKSAAAAKKYKRARASYLNAAQIFPEKPAPIKKICMMYLYSNQLDSAGVYLKKLQQAYLPQHSKLLSEIKYGQALWYEKREKYDSAIAVNKELLQLRPKNAFNIYSGIGDNYQKKGDYKAALEAYKKAQQTYQSSHHRFSASYNYKIGECYEKLSNRQQAKKYYTQAQAGGYSLPEEVKEEFGL